MLSFRSKIYVIILLLVLGLGVLVIKKHPHTNLLPRKSPATSTTSLQYVNLGFVGDIMLDRGVRSSVNKNFAGDYSKLFDNLEALKDYDILFGNLEGTASDKGRRVGSIYSFQMDPAVIPVLKNASFDVLSVANNHMGDYTLASYLDTLNRLKEAGILYAGGGNNKAEAVEPTIIEKNGIKIGYLAFSDKGPDWMQVTDTRGGLLTTKDLDLGPIIQNASAKVDYLVISFHFGEEYQKIHNSRQSYLAHTAIDNGAKLVIGAHPHVMEDFEVYKKGLVAYSLGNFIFDQYFSTDTMQGMLLGVKLYKNGELEMTKNIIKLNKYFQPDHIIPGTPEIISFQ